MDNDIHWRLGNMGAVLADRPSSQQRLSLFRFIYHHKRPAALSIEPLTLSCGVGAISVAQISFAQCRLFRRKCFSESLVVEELNARSNLAYQAKKAFILG